MNDTAMIVHTMKPVTGLSDFVESFWMIQNDLEADRDIIVLPDGRFDIIFSAAANDPFHATLRGLDTQPEQALIPVGSTMFAVSFKLLAVEYLLDIKMASVLNRGHRLPAGFWKITAEDLNNFEAFCNKISAIMLALLQPDIDSRKKKLFDLIYASNGSLTVQELAERVGWSNRQINRYFTGQFGISLKAYCNIFRFRASLLQIKEGRFFPEQNFADQNHFIRAVKKMSGVTPKELAKNKNDRFILLSGI